MNEPIYLNDWSNSGQAGMIEDFGIDASALQGAAVIVASYTYENYEGSAYVLFERDGKLFEVHGGHCSCYGLSEVGYSGQPGSQWDPSEIEIDAIKHRVENGQPWEYEPGVRDAVQAFLAEREK